MAELDPVAGAAAVRFAIADVVAAWATWRADPEYPRRDHLWVGVNRERDALVGEVAAELHALPADVGLDLLVPLANKVLGPAWGLTAGEQPVADAVEGLRKAVINGLGG